VIFYLQAPMPTNESSKGSAIRTFSDQCVQADLDIPKTPSVTPTKPPLLEDLSNSSPGSSRDSGIGSGVTSGSRFRRNRVTGCGPTDNRVAALTTVRELFIYNLSPSVTYSGLRQYLQASVEVLGLRRISHQNSRSQSFLVTVPVDSEGFLLDPHFWPKGVQCQYFVRPPTGRLANVYA
jgi:hypothetical protein